MLTPEQQLTIKTLLDQENSQEVIETLILSYASNVKRASRLLSLIPKIAQKQLELTEYRVIEYSSAVNLLIGERANKTKKSKKCNSPSTFSTLIYVSKAYFPNGTSNGGSAAGKEFFNEFINAVKNKTGFDYKSSVDWAWICNVVECRDWMIQVIKQNIDENFIEPDLEKGY